VGCWTFPRLLIHEQLTPFVQNFDDDFSDCHTATHATFDTLKLG
jgi:hypothetical protein